MTTTATPDPTRIGISYSGGGPLLVVELGIARAFVQFGIKPAVICGASAGAFVAAAHALDIDAGKGIDGAITEVGQLSNATLKLDAGDFALRLLREREHLKSIGDNAPAAQLIGNVVSRLVGKPEVTLGEFGQPMGPAGQVTPELHVVATDIGTQHAYWFGPAGKLQDALIASSAIPGIFPWRDYVFEDGTTHFLVDGGLVENQPLQRLADLGCGRIYACAVGEGAAQTEPQNLLENVLRSVNVSIHTLSKVEEQLLRSTLPADCRVIHIHPEVTTAIVDFNFTPALVKQVVDEACQLTLDWLKTDPQT